MLTSLNGRQTLLEQGVNEIVRLRNDRPRRATAESPDQLDSSLSAWAENARPDE